VHCQSVRIPLTLRAVCRRVHGDGEGDRVGPGSVRDREPAHVWCGVCRVMVVVMAHRQAKEEKREAAKRAKLEELQKAKQGASEIVVVD
jgi:hypothetical protein